MEYKIPRNLDLTIAKWLKIESFPFVIRNAAGYPLYEEFEDGTWIRREFDAEGRELRYEDSTGLWSNKTFDRFGLIAYESSRGLKLDSGRIPMDGC